MQGGVQHPSDTAGLAAFGYGTRHAPGTSTTDSRCSSRSAGANVNTYASQGDLPDAILDIAEEQNADLVIVGNKGMTGATCFLPDKVERGSS
jgi:nucleotide-binding universal stress UspA family protein